LISIKTWKCIVRGVEKDGTLGIGRLEREFEFLEHGDRAKMSKMKMTQSPNSSS